LGFTLVDVMMGAVILGVGLIGLIEALLIGSEMQATARRQTTAAQIVSNEIELLRLKDWTTISTLPLGTSYTTWNAGTTYLATDLVRSGGIWYRCISGNSNQPPPNGTYWAADMGWNAAIAYRITDLVRSGGIWYRCIANNTNQPPASNPSSWTIYDGPIDKSGIDSAATFSVFRTFAAGPNGLVEVTFTVTWIAKPSGSPVSRTYMRVVTAYFGKYGLNLTYQRS